MISVASMTRVIATCSGFVSTLLFATTLHAATITFSGVVTTQSNLGPVVVTIAGTDFYAFERIVSGSVTGIASGFSSVSGPVSMTFGDFVLLNAGYGYENYGPGPGAFLNIYEGSTLIGTAHQSQTHLDIAADGSASGYGTDVLDGPPGSAFYQEILARSGGVLDITYDQFQALTYTPGQSANHTGNFAISGTIFVPDAVPVPEPATLLLVSAGTGSLIAKARRRRSTRR
jgi:hypothetical protein